MKRINGDGPRTQLKLSTLPEAPVRAFRRLAVLLRLLTAPLAAQETAGPLRLRGITFDHWDGAGGAATPQTHVAGHQSHPRAAGVGLRAGDVSRGHLASGRWSLRWGSRRVSLIVLPSGRSHCCPKGAAPRSRRTQLLLLLLRVFRVSPCLREKRSTAPIPPRAPTPEAASGPAPTNFGAVETVLRQARDLRRDRRRQRIRRGHGGPGAGARRVAGAAARARRLGGPRARRTGPRRTSAS